MPQYSTIKEERFWINFCYATVEASRLRGVEAYSTHQSITRLVCYSDILIV